MWNDNFRYKASFSSKLIIEVPCLREKQLNMFLRSAFTILNNAITHVTMYTSLTTPIITSNYLSSYQHKYNEIRVLSKLLKWAHSYSISQWIFSKTWTFCQKFHVSDLFLRTKIYHPPLYSSSVIFRYTIPCTQ